jgi:hypothetical protein
MSGTEEGDVHVEFLDGSGLAADNLRMVVYADPQWRLAPFLTVRRKNGEVYHVPYASVKFVSVKPLPPKAPDKTRLEEEVPATKLDKMNLCEAVIRELDGGERKGVDRLEVKKRLQERLRMSPAMREGDQEADQIIRAMFREGRVYESKPGFIKRLG